MLGHPPYLLTQDDNQIPPPPQYYTPVDLLKLLSPDEILQGLKRQPDLDGSNAHALPRSRYCREELS